MRVAAHGDRLPGTVRIEQAAPAGPQSVREFNLDELSGAVIDRR
jgi:hypothetical protein